MWPGVVTETVAAQGNRAVRIGGVRRYQLAYMPRTAGGEPRGTAVIGNQIVGACAGESDCR